MTANERILERLRQAIELFRRGELSLAEFAQAILAHGHALEGMGRAWHDILNRTEGQLDVLQFTAEDPRAAAEPVIAELVAAIDEASR
jgi:hypothetical protein